MTESSFDRQNHNSSSVDRQSFTLLQSEIQSLRRDSKNGNDTQFSADLVNLNRELHQMGVLPSVSLAYTDSTGNQPAPSSGSDRQGSGAIKQGQPDAWQGHGCDHDPERGSQHGSGYGNDLEQDHEPWREHKWSGSSPLHSFSHHHHHRHHYHEHNQPAGDTGGTSNSPPVAGGSDSTTSSATNSGSGSGSDNPASGGKPGDTTGDTTGDTARDPAPVITDGQFTVQGGQIVGPDGKPFIARGIAVKAATAVQDEAEILKYFPGVNMIRLSTGADGNTYTGKGRTPEQVAQETQQFIDDMTKRGIVVEVDNHEPGDRHVPATGAALQNEENWYAQLAKTNKDNPYVWFQTPNEPVPGNDANFVKDAVAEEKAVYNAVRATGNDNMVVLEMASNYTANKITGEPDVFPQYADMKDVVFDYHMYDRSPAFIKQRLASTAPITDTQGVIPAIIGEYGNTDSGGTTVSAAGDANLKAVQESGLGSIAWALTNMGGTADVNQLVDGKGNLTDYGQEVANYINGNA